MILLACATAFWLGILTSVSPCPLATNVAAVSYISRHVGSPGKVILHGISYSVRRTLTYLGLSMAIIAGIASMPEVSGFLQRYMNRIIGPVLVLTGMVLLDLLHFEVPSMTGSPWLQKLAGRKGLGSTCVLGMLFALSLCPVAAALFFGGLIPLAVKHGSPFVMPALYGIGTALPVAAFALVIAFWTGRIGKVFDSIRRMEKGAQVMTGLIFVVVGVYYSLAYIFEVV
ncbi:sulfite exporter TauE/SafE family protein [bacterium]|nr:sulfite exporter TauE/SafE family protein [bacterium]